MHAFQNDEPKQFLPTGHNNTDNDKSVYNDNNNNNNNKRCP